MPQAVRMSAEMAIVPVVGAGLGWLGCTVAVFVAVAGDRASTGFASPHAVTASETIDSKAGPTTLGYGFAFMVKISFGVASRSKREANAHPIDSGAFSTAASLFDSRQAHHVARCDYVLLPCDQRSNLRYSVARSRPRICAACRLFPFTACITRSM